MFLYKVSSYYYVGGDDEDERDCVFSSPEKAKEWLIGNPHLHDAYINEHDLDHSPTPEEMKKLVEESLDDDNITIEKVDFDPLPINTILQQKDHSDQS